MHPETPFRWTFLAIMVLTAVTAGRFRIRAHRAGGSVSRRGEGRFLLVSIRLAAVVLWVAALVYLIAPDQIRWASLGLRASLRWSGLPLALIGAGLIYWALSHLGHNLTDTVAVRASATLITDGPYRWVRHPFYTACLLLFGGVVLITANWFIGLMSLLIFSLLVVRTHREEAELIRHFGQAYLDYMARTGRFWPRLRQGA